MLSDIEINPMVYGAVVWRKKTGNFLRYILDINGVEFTCTVNTHYTVKTGQILKVFDSPYMWLGTINQQYITVDFTKHAIDPTHYEIVKVDQSIDNLPLVLRDNDTLGIDETSGLLSVIVDKCDLVLLRLEWPMI
jgi:hypothetical protein